LPNLLHDSVLVLQVNTWLILANYFNYEQNFQIAYTTRAGEKMAAAAEAEPAVTVTDVVDDSAQAVIADGCGGIDW